MAKRNEPVPSSINDRVQVIMEGERFALARPTQSHVDDYNIAAAEFGEQLSKLHALVEVDLAKLEKDMEAAGTPWTPGRGAEGREEKENGRGVSRDHTGQKKKLQHRGQKRTTE